MPGNEGPKLRIVKTLGNCCAGTYGGVANTSCTFSISVTNIGTVPYSGPLEVKDSDPNSLSGTGGFSGPITLAPGETKLVGSHTRGYVPGTKFLNCAALGTRPPNNSGPPGPDISCIAGDVPAPAGVCQAEGPRPPPPTTTLTCPPGATVINGQCVFTFPVCRGNDCPLCADGKPRNSDGNCPTPTTTTCPFNAVPVNGICCTREDLTAGRCGGGQPAGCGPNQFRGDDGKCQNRPTSRCGANQTWNGETCVNDTKKKPKKKTKPPRRSKPDSDSPTTSAPPAGGLQIQIGPGGGGGFPRGGNKPPSGGGQPPSGGGLNRQPRG